MTEAKIETSALCYQEVDWILGSVMAAPTGAGVYEIKATTANTPQFYTVQWGQSGACKTFAGGVVTGATFKFDRDKIDVSADMIGGQMTTGTYNTTAVATVGCIPILPSDVVVELDTVAMPRSFNLELAITNRFGDVWVQNGVDSYVTVVEKIPTITCKQTIEVNSQFDDILTELRADNSPRQLEILCSNGTQSLHFDMKVRVGGITEFKDEGGVYAVGIDWIVVYDTYAIKATLTMS